MKCWQVLRTLGTLLGVQIGTVTLQNIWALFLESAALTRPGTYLSCDMPKNACGRTNQQKKNSQATRIKMKEGWIEQTVAWSYMAQLENYFLCTRQCTDLQHKQVAEEYISLPS